MDIERIVRPEGVNAVPQYLKKETVKCLVGAVEHQWENLLREFSKWSAISLNYKAVGRTKRGDF